MHISQCISIIMVRVIIRDDLPIMMLIFVNVDISTSLSNVYCN